MRPAARALLASLLGLTTIGCQPAPRAPKRPPVTGAERTLVVINRRSAASDSVGRYYAAQRGLARDHIVVIDTDTADDIGTLAYRTGIESPVRHAIDALPVRIDFVVLTPGVPLRVGGDRGYSTDALLAGMRFAFAPMVGLDTAWLRQHRNPYFNAPGPFDSERYGMYLVTRLACGVPADCRALVDRAIAARPVQGPFFLDGQPARQGADGYAELNAALVRAGTLLQRAGGVVQLDTSPRFLAPPAPVMGYVSWGSNDPRYDSTAYRAVRFLPGALAETFVSTSARTFGAVTGGQSRIVDLIAQGVTGVKGYVSEPYTFAMARPELLFDRYVRGATLAEAFYAASPMVLWKDVVVGDPLCAPYRRAGAPLR